MPHAVCFVSRGQEGQEGIGLHVAASLITGVVATTVAAPFDMIKTRMMNDSAGATARYASAGDALYQTVSKEGLAALLRGWWPAYFRLGPHALICFPVFEQMRAFVGIDFL